ncbi:MAG TPA: hypothetical protein VMT50_11110 [Steroidobacteraceae bacterium]|nr:hypothetical protein [Steroidobacteraceae bacterium]
MRRGSLIFLLAFAAVVAATGCGHQEPSSGVQGIVVASEGGRVLASESPSPLPGGFPSEAGVRLVKHARVLVWTAVTERRRGALVARTWATAQGLFRVHLPAGSYLVGVKQDPASLEYVTVARDQYARVVVVTGARFGSRVSECPTSASSRTPAGLP